MSTAPDISPTRTTTCRAWSSMRQMKMPVKKAKTTRLSEMQPARVRRDTKKIRRVSLGLTRLFYFQAVSGRLAATTREQADQATEQARTETVDLHGVAGAARLTAHFGEHVRRQVDTEFAAGRGVVTHCRSAPLGFS